MTESLNQLSVHLRSKLNLYVVHIFCLSVTFNRISGESQLADDVTRDVRFDALALFSVSFSGLQKVVKFLRVKLLETQQHTLAYAAGMNNV